MRLEEERKARTHRDQQTLAMEDVSEGGRGHAWPFFRQRAEWTEREPMWYDYFEAHPSSPGIWMTLDGL